MATERPASRAYAPQLDGLRAVAVAAVAYSHWLPAWQFGLPFGAGVHLFFVLSGFLITRLLLDARTAADRPAAVRQFFVRRALRLFPAFYVVLGAAWAADVPRAATTWPWHAAYLSNVYTAWQGVWQGHFSHFWSLAVEQQFYLAFPWLVVWSPARWLGPAFGLTVLAGPLAHAAAAARGLPEPFWALVPAGSADSLGVGALVAWLDWRRTRGRAAVWAWAAAGGAVAWAALALAERRGMPMTPLLTVGRQLLQAGMFGAVVWRAARGFDGPIGRLLSHPRVVHVGRISYGLYLVHPFAPGVLHALLSPFGADVFAWPAPVRAAAAWTASVALAQGLWVVVERPAHRLKARLSAR
ncbi:MAG: acyltransferase [Vicinamibacterales bacterium]